VAGRNVRVISPDGRPGEIPEEDLSVALEQGYRPEAMVQREQRESDLQAEYGGLGGQLVTGVRGLLGGASINTTDALSDNVQGAILGRQLDETGYRPPQLTPEARARFEDPAIRARMAELGVAELPRDQSNFDIGRATAREDRRNYEEANPVTDMATRGLGAVGAVALSGGSSLAAATPAAMAGRAALGAAEATAKKLGGGALGRMGAAIVGGATEGAIVQGVDAVANNLPQFLTDPMEAGEHVVYAIAQGALLGGGAGATFGGAHELARGAVSALGSAAHYGASQLSDLAGDTFTPEGLRRMAGESAYKAVVGRTNKAAISAAERHGGAEAVGRTLLDEGIPLAGTVEQRAAATAQRAEEIGAALGAKVREIDAMGGAPITGDEILKRIDEKVMKPLQGNIFADDIANAVEGKLERFRGVLGDGKPVSFDDVRSMRMDLDATLLKWQQAGPPTPTTQALRDVRTELEGAWLDAADQSAESVGVKGFAAEVKALKTKYAHMRLSADQAEQAVQTKLANRAFSPSDYGMSLGGMVAGGPVAGLAMGVANNVARERGRGAVAIALNSFADMAEQRGAMAAAANGASAQLARTAQRFVDGVGASKYAVRDQAAEAVVSKWSESDFARAVAETRELQDPSSPARQELVQTAQQLDAINPGMGVSFAKSVQARAEVIASRLPKSSGAAIYASKPVLDPISERSLQRTVRAAYEPDRALERIAAGSSAHEDLDTVRQVYPQLYRAFQKQVQAGLSQQKVRPTYEQRLRIGFVTGLTTDPSMELDNLRLQQAYAAGPDFGKIEEAKAEAKDHADAESLGDPYGTEKPKFRDADSVFAGPVDSRIDRR
jgi:hypothetical protein